MNATTDIDEAQNAKACPQDCVKLKGVFWLLVAAQFMIAGMMVILLESAFRFWWTGIMAVCGIAIGVWAMVSLGRRTVNISPAVRQTASLIIRGPYRFVRHPMYTALAVFCGAIALSDRSTFALELWIALVVVLAIKSAYEEGMLKRQFPDYADYAKRVKRCIPFIL